MLEFDPYVSLPKSSVLPRKGQDIKPVPSSEIYRSYIGNLRFISIHNCALSSPILLETCDIIDLSNLESYRDLSV